MYASIYKLSLNTVIMYLNWSACIFVKSCKKGLITKGHTVMNMHLKVVIKRVLHFSTLAIKCLNSGTKLFQAETL